MGGLPQGWDTVLLCHVDVLKSLRSAGDYRLVYGNVEKELKAVIEVIRGENDWSLPILYTVCLELRNAAIAADRECLEGAGEKLSRAFSVLNDRKPASISKKKGSMRLINIMFDVYFRLHNYRLCSAPRKILEGPGYPRVEEYPVSHVVTYRYYTGRLHLFDAEYIEAERDLSYCFHGCPRSHFRNKRLSLIFLVPAALMLGKLPKPQLLEKYRLPEYKEITIAVQCGDLALFNRALSQWEALFRKRGLYLLLETLKWLVYRKLFKRTFKMLVAPGSSPVLTVDVLQCSLRACGVLMETEEVECIVANLIHRKFVKGYMACRKDKTFVIFSQKDAFPAMEPQ